MDASQRKDIQDKALEHIREAVLSATPARAVYLFGSRAYGEPRPESDYDILVVTWDLRPDREVRQAIREGVERAIPVDLHVVSPATFEWRKRFANTIERASERKGVLLYMAEESADYRAMAEEWFQRAQEDLEAAGVLVGRAGLTVSACFHAQQCVEKCLKGYLTYHDVEAARTHVLEDLVDQCAGVDSSFAEWRDVVAPLSPYAVQSRYPGGPLPSMEDARRAVETAERVKAFIRERVNG
jgi:HEPN domain-containing protein/predicted nucleotidyltransferase